MPRLPVARVALSIIVGLAALGCQRTTSPDAHSDLAAVLPTDAPYILGTIVAQDDRFDGTLSALVASNPNDIFAAASAHVMLGGEHRVYWRTGQHATTEDLQPGRVVTAWVGPVELRSLPPIVSARVVVIER